jgi:hypothetical protein
LLKINDGKRRRSWTRDISMNLKKKKLSGVWLHREESGMERQERTIINSSECGELTDILNKLSA